VTRAVYRFVKWTAEPDMEPDAEPFTLVMQCAVCGERSAVSQEIEAGQDWILKHAAGSGDHHSYREIFTRPYRAVRAGP
jgi:hypothetical protein